MLNMARYSISDFLRGWRGRLVSLRSREKAFRMQLTGVLEAICSRRVSQEDKGRQYSDGRTHQDELRLSRSEALEGL